LITVGKQDQEPILEDQIMYTQTTEFCEDQKHLDLQVERPRNSVRIQSLRAHETLFNEGDDADCLYEILEGVICTYRILFNGSRQIVSFNFPGDLVGLSSTDRHTLSAEAVSSARLRRLGKSDLSKALRDDPKLGNKLLNIAAKKLANLQDHFVNVGRKSAFERVASFLLTLARRSQVENSEYVEFDLPMTRTDIADYLGLTIETVSRTFTKLKIANVIDLPQLKRVVVHDINRLEGLSECDGNHN